jgi:hypothetical protein
MVAEFKRDLDAYEENVLPSVTPTCCEQTGIPPSEKGGKVVKLRFFKIAVPRF